MKLGYIEYINILIEKEKLYEKSNSKKKIAIQKSSKKIINTVNLTLQLQDIDKMIGIIYN